MSEAKIMLLLQQACVATLGLVTFSKEILEPDPSSILLAIGVIAVLVAFTLMILTVKNVK